MELLDDVDIQFDIEIPVEVEDEDELTLVASPKEPQSEDAS